MKFDDVNGNATRDEGEPGIKDWTITLWTENGKADGLQMSGDDADASKSVKTDVDGKYSFGSLTVGTYFVVEDCPSGWVQTYPNTDKDLGTCDYYTINVTSGFEELDNDFGNFKLGTKAGYKWNDVSANGFWDGTEPGINSVTVQLWSDIDGSGSVTAADVLVATQVTANGGPLATDGYYAFTGLTAGKYVVAEVCQTGWIQSFPTPGLGCGTGVHAITVTSGFSRSEQQLR